LFFPQCGAALAFGKRAFCRKGTLRLPPASELYRKTNTAAAGRSAEPSLKYNKHGCCRALGRAELKIQ